MKKFILYLSFFYLFFSVSCKQLTYKKQVQNHVIKFGSGGGFTGAIDEYILHANGSLFTTNSLKGDTTLLKKYTFKEIKNIYNLTDNKELRKLSLSESGNLNHFIQLLDGEKIVFSFNWPDGKSDIHPLIKELYSELNELK